MLSVAEALLLFVNSMPCPVIPVSHFELCCDNCDNEQLRRNIIVSLSPAQQTLFEYIIAFLKEVVKHADATKSKGPTADVLARLFANAILRPAKGHKFGKCKINQL